MPDTRSWGNSMIRESYFSSAGAGLIRVRTWEPEGAPIGIVQIIHGIVEHVERYNDFAKYLNQLGYLVVAEDHMGHGKSGGNDCARGYFYGGWFAAVDDSYRLLRDTMDQYPGLPYVLLGHSMGSFMARTILAKYPNSGISGAVLSGTGWMPEFVLKAGQMICKMNCKLFDETQPNEKLQNLAFGTYNARVERPRTTYDWLNRDAKEVDAYIADPNCGFVASGGLMRDMMTGMLYIQKKKTIQDMNKSVPIYFVAGGDDPVGNYGDGVRKAVAAFKRAGVKDVSCKIYPLCRHEILNEINNMEVYHDISTWIQKLISSKCPV